MDRLDPRRPVQCRGCDVVFARDPKRPTRQYHSWECFKASRHVTETCTVCGQTFDSYLSEARKRKARGHVPCCSRACRNSYTSTFLGGDGTWTEGGRHNPKSVSSWRWRQARDAFVRTIGPMCEGCEGVPWVHVHHLHPRALGGPLYAPDNLMAVCKECHDNMHEQLRAGAFADSFEGVAFDAALAGRR